MCLAVPLKVLSVDGETAKVWLNGVMAKISIALTPGVKAGDWVLVHAGFAINRIGEKEALETISLLEELDDFNQGKNKTTH